MTKAKTKKRSYKRKKKATIREPRAKTVDEVISEYQSEIEVRESPPESPAVEEVIENHKPPDIERRRLRYILFRAKAGTMDGMDRDLRELAPALKEFFESELGRKGLTWAGFTFTWDVAPNDTFNIIGPSMTDWVDRGGEFEGRPGQMTEAEWAKHVVAEGITARRKPPAFTRQE